MVHACSCSIDIMLAYIICHDDIISCSLTHFPYCHGVVALREVVHSIHVELVYEVNVPVGPLVDSLDDRWSSLSWRACEPLVSSASVLLCSLLWCIVNTVVVESC